MDYNQIIKELTMTLLYLTSWTEKGLNNCQRSWKGYDFDILNELEDDGFIIDSKRSKSVILSEYGINVAKELLRKYGLEE